MSSERVDVGEGRGGVGCAVVHSQSPRPRPAGQRACHPCPLPRPRRFFHLRDTVCKNIVLTKTKL